MGVGDNPNVERRIDQRSDSDLPYQVYEVEGGRCKGYDSLEEAETARDDRNFRASSLGIRSRYEVRTLRKSETSNK